MSTKIEWAQEIIQKFWANIDDSKNDPSNCWNWKAGKFSSGYGQFRVGKKKWRAHRLMYEYVFGKIPKGMLVCHKCDNPSCVRPSHLFLGTPKQNANDRDKKGRAAIGNLIPQKGTSNGSSKLSKSMAIQIRVLFDCGISPSKISRAYKISKSQVRNIGHRRAWKCLTAQR